MDKLSRRRFVAGAAGIGLVAGCRRLPGQLQPQALKAPRLGILATEEDEATLGQFQQGLADLGYTVGRNVLIEIRHGEGHEQLLALAAEMVSLPVDIVVTQGQTATTAARRATNTIPVVQMAGGGDLVEAGLITSLARPGGNVTGLTSMAPQLSGKRLELLGATVPGLSRVAVLLGIDFGGNMPTRMELQRAAQVLGLELQLLQLHDADGIESAFDVATMDHAEALFVLNSPLTLSRPQRIADLAAQRRLPAMYARREFVAAGGLMAYGPNGAGQHRRAAYYVDRILKGARPADLPVEQPMTFDFVVNLKTAQALGITFPNEIMLQVTEVIQ